jgi:hypothetical protein
MARFTATPDGEIVGLTVLLPTATDLPPAGPNELDFDEATNQAILAAFDTDSRAFTLTGGALRRNGVAVVVNPPGAVEQDRITPTTAAAVLAQLQTYRDLTAPSGAQTLAVVKLLCRIAQVLIRRLA